MVMAVSNNTVSESLTWHSLFLPLKGKVIFASFTTLLNRPQKQKKPSDQACSWSNNSPAAVETPVSNNTRSPLFALCGERADTILCVLEDRHVLFFDLTDGQHGPKEIMRLPGTSHLHGFRSSIATCASLISFDIAHLCRVSFGDVLSSTSFVLDGADNGTAATTTVTPASGKTLYLRGVVGSNDGRVDVFSENGYVFGFVAYDAPLEAVNAIYFSNDFGGAAREPYSSCHTVDMGIAGSAETRNAFEKAIANLGFVTCSGEGVIYVWRAEHLSFKPKLFDKASLFSRIFKFHVVQPSNRDILLGDVGFAGIPILVHTTPGFGHQLRVRSVVTLEDVEPRIELPSKCLTRTTAIACNEKIALVARETDVYCVVFAEACCKFVFTASSSVTGMYIDNNGLAAATCNKGGLLYILRLQPLELLGRYAVRGGGPIRSVSLHRASSLVAVVNGRGAVEVLLLPENWRDGAAADVADVLHAARALRCLVDLLQRRGESSSSPSPTYESLLLARMVIPHDTRKELRHVSA